MFFIFVCFQVVCSNKTIYSGHLNVIEIPDGIGNYKLTKKKSKLFNLLNFQYLQ